MNNLPHTKIPSMLALGLTVAGSVLVINQSDAREGMANIQIELEELPKVQLASDYKPCGNTIKCPPPPPEYEEPEEENTAEASNDNSDKNNNSNENSDQNSNSSQSSSQTTYTAPKKATEYNPSQETIEKLESEFESKVAPIINIDDTESIEEFLQEELSKQSTVVKVHGQDGQKAKIKNDRKIAFINDLEAAKTKRANNTNNELIIDPSTDSDGDRLSDLAEILFFSTNPFEKDSDLDGINDGDEIDYGTPPNTDSKPDIHEPAITNLNGLTTDGNPIIKGVGLPNETVVIKSYSLESKKTTIVCTVEVDIIGKFACQPDKEIEDGTYYLYSNHLSDNDEDQDDRKFSRIEVDNSQKTETKEAKIEEINKQNYDNLLSSKDTLKKYLGSNIYQNYISKYLDFLENSGDSKKQVLAGTANPSEIILVTWQSYSLNSVLIADASKGQFETIVPEALESGEHRAFVYNYDTSSKFLSFISKIIFNKS